MKNKIKILFAVAMIALCAPLSGASKKSIVCTSFPEYDWVMNILGNKSSTFDVTLLQNNGTDLHSYQASIKDIAKISTADFFVYTGGESDEWIEKVLKSKKNKSMIVLNMMQELGDRVRQEELVEGMQAEDEESEEDEEEPEYDEHIWLSIKNAIFLTKVLSQKIQLLDSANKELYKANTDSYISKLSALDSEYEKTVASAKNKFLLFADRFPFRYLTEDYNLKYYAAFAGCSAESEASFETIAFLAKKTDELKLPVILTLEKNDKKIAKTVVSTTKNKNQQIMEMDSLQSITQKEIAGGRNYISAMKKNLEVLKKALN